MFNESGDANPTYRSMAAGANFFRRRGGRPATRSTSRRRERSGVLTIEVATVNRASDCHAQAQGVLTG